ncbi:GNAT family protein [Nocardioides sp. TF02-7]|uniref:GNAT family N-acetyltransferase n=1 Tax=Nocardioides sp. TF02-7 TaxID=2917724 RepID=UPI0031F484BE
MRPDEPLRSRPRERMTTATPGRAWPNVLISGTDPVVTLRPIRRSDARAWRTARRRNAAWLAPWDATVPPGGEARPTTFGALVRRLNRAARRGTTYPFVIEVDGRFAGQVSINNIVRGSAQFASVGYWIDQQFAGRGVMPRAVAMAIDHCFFTARLHRVEVCIRPENTNSLRVVEKLGIREIGYAPRFLHIDGDWRDHRIFAVTKEDAPRGLLARLTEAGGGRVGPAVRGALPPVPVGGLGALAGGRVASAAADSSRYVDEPAPPTAYPPWEAATDLHTLMNLRRPPPPTHSSHQSHKSFRDTPLDLRPILR